MKTIVLFCIVSTLTLNLFCEPSSGEKLNAAIADGNVDQINRLLDQKTDIEYLNSDRQTPLLYSLSYYVSEENRHKVIPVLISRGANIEARDTYGYTPFLKAVSYDDLQSCILLKKSGANIEVIVSGSSDPTAQMFETARGFGAMHLAADQGCTKVIGFLIKCGLNVNDYSVGKTPLHVAARSMHYETIKVLLRFGARANVKDSYNQTPLELAESFKDTKGQEDDYKKTVSILKQYK
jgi:ankyrin repeat protein